jgi:hypothetical protein
LLSDKGQNDWPLITTGLIARIQTVLESAPQRDSPIFIYFLFKKKLDFLGFWVGAKKGRFRCRLKGGLNRRKPGTCTITGYSICLDSKLDLSACLWCLCID